jgi:hypothetical protein
MKMSTLGVGTALAFLAATTFGAEEQKMICRVTGKKQPDSRWW